MVIIWLGIFDKPQKKAGISLPIIVVGISLWFDTQDTTVIPLHT